MTVKVRQRGIAHFEESVRAFSATVADGRARTASMSGRTTDAAQDSEMLRRALEELERHQEELTVADEELRAQLDELALTNARVHVERNHYRELFDISPDGYFVTDRLAVIRDANVAAAKMVNLDLRFLIGKPLATLVDLADTRLFRDAIDLLAARPNVALDVRLRPRGGEPTWYALKATPVEGGTALLWIARELRVATTHTATDDDPAAPLSTRVAGLERANRDKAELLDRERRLREELAAADTAKDRFIAVLSHDLRGPINSILGWTQLLRREPLDHAARDRALATIERNAQAQVQLVEELLDISRIASNRLQLERATLDLSEIVRRAVETAGPVARERGIELDSVVSDRLVVFGDRARLEQVIGNLLSNAFELTPKGGRVSVLLERDGAHARIATQDTGRGIAPQRLPVIFDPLRQASDYAATTEGLGFGLYIVRRAVEMHGGTVSAQSEGEGRGSRFTVLLPLVTADSPAVRRPAPESEGSLRSEEALDGVRVLVVDDDEDRRALMASILRLHGATLTTASDDATARLAFDASPPDVVVTDVATISAAGLTLVRDLRARPDLGAALVAVSGFDAPDVERVLEAGFDMHLAKPIDPSDLVTAVGDAARGVRR